MRGGGDEGVCAGDVCLDVDDLKADPRLGLPARPGQQPLRPEAGEDILLLLLVFLVAGEDPGAGPPGDHQQLGQVHRGEVPDDLLHQLLATVLGDDMAVLLLVLLVAAVSAVWKYLGETGGPRPTTPYQHCWPTLEQIWSPRPPPSSQVCSPGTPPAPRRGWWPADC